MPTERVKDRIADGSADQNIAERMRQGWRIAAIEWQRELPPGAPELPDLIDPPYGFRVASDNVHLEPDHDEMEVLSQITAMIVQERRAPEISAALNRQRFRTRDGGEWTAVGVFALMPRIIESGPAIFSQPDWAERRRTAV